MIWLLCLTTKAFNVNLMPNWKPEGYLEPCENLWWSFFVKMVISVIDVWLDSKYASGYFLYVMLCAIWYNLYNSNNVKNAHAGVLRLVKLQVFRPQLYLLKVTLLHGCFSRLLNCTNDTKLRSASYILLYIQVVVALWSKGEGKKFCFESFERNLKKGMPAPFLVVYKAYLKRDRSKR